MGEELFLFHLGADKNWLAVGLAADSFRFLVRQSL